MPVPQRAHCISKAGVATVRKEVAASHGQWNKEEVTLLVIRTNGSCGAKKFLVFLAILARREDVKEEGRQNCGSRES